MELSGKLIAFEGIEGSGKSTQILNASAWLTNKGFTHLVTREPGGTHIGQQIRQLLLNCNPGPAPMAELLLYYADRWQHAKEILLPAMRRGEIVLTDRFYHSSLAYQGYGREIDHQIIRQLNHSLAEKLTPLLVILFDLPAQEALRRIRGERDRLESEGPDFHERVRHGYLHLADNDASFRIVDACLTEDAVFEQVEVILEHFLERRGQ